MARSRKENGTVSDRKRSGRTLTTTDAFSRGSVLAAINLNPITTTEEVSRQSGIPRSTVQQILAKEGFHAYKIRFVHMLKQDDLTQRMDFSEMMMDRVNADASLLKRVCWGDECTMHLNGRMNHQNIRFYSKENPHLCSASNARTLRS